MCNDSFLVPILFLVLLLSNTLLNLETWKYIKLYCFANFCYFNTYLLLSGQRINANFSMSRLQRNFRVWKNWIKQQITRWSLVTFLVFRRLMLQVLMQRKYADCKLQCNRENLKKIWQGNCFCGAKYLEVSRTIWLCSCWIYQASSQPANTIFGTFIYCSNCNCCLMNIKFVAQHQIINCANCLITMRIMIIKQEI